MEIITRISGPEPGYIACSICIVQVGWGGRGERRARAGRQAGSGQLHGYTSLVLRPVTPRTPHQAPPPGLPSPFSRQAAVTLLEERDKLPAPGVHTPASLLRRTTYIERLQRRGVKFEQLESAAVQ